MPSYADAITSLWKDRRVGKPTPVARPSIQHLIGNAAMPFDAARTRARAGELAAAIRGDGRKILLIPGLMASEHRMEPMRAILNAAGFEAYGWDMGRNLGPRLDTLEKIDRRIEEIGGSSGAKVTLVGWSLGGIFAREYAKVAHAKVEGVVTMGTPFSGDPRANHAWQLYQWVAGHPVDRPPLPCKREEKPPVPTVALWSQRDGVILPACSRGCAGERDRAMEVDCTHMGFATAPEGILAVARALEIMKR